MSDQTIEQRLDEILQNYYDNTDDFVVGGMGFQEDNEDTAKQALLQLLNEAQQNTRDIMKMADTYTFETGEKYYNQRMMDEATNGARNKDLTPDDMLLAQNTRLIEAGDALYERASYTGREFDGTHRLLSAAANWLDVRGKNSGEYQAQLTPKENIEWKRNISTK